MSYQILAPSLRASDGIGHLARMLALHDKLVDSYLVIPEDKSSILSRIDRDPGTLRIVTSPGEIPPGREKQSGLLILDTPWISEPELSSLLQYAPVVAIDLGGASRSLASYLIDTLPYPGDRLHRQYFSTPPKEKREKEGALSTSKGFPGGGAGLAEALDLTRAEKGNWQGPNISDPGFLPLPQKRRAPDAATDRVLVSFGGTDPAGLTETFLACLTGPEVADGSNVPGSIVGEIILPVHRNVEKISLPPGWEYGNFRADLDFTRYDVFVTAYGLGAWESQYAGTKTLIIDASFYHAELARRSGFLSVPSQELGSVFSQLSNPEFKTQLQNQAGQLGSLVSRSLEDEISTLKAPERHCCAACGNQSGLQVLARDKDRSFFSCPRCKTITQLRFRPHQISYDEDYFFSQYKNQYGRSYLDDFEHIKNMGKTRVDRVLKRISAQEPQPRLLDIGCAYGPFLSAAAEKGCSVEGSDISAAAVNHVREKLGFTAWLGDVSDPEFRGQFPQAAYDAVSMWYVVEHFPDLSEILPWIHGLLKPWGVFALSTPSSRGVSAGKNLPSFLLNGPEDHYTVWNQQQAAELGALHGFYLDYWISTGHHPERFPGILGSKFFSPLSALASRMLSLGDTFEAYFIRMDTPSPENK